MSPAQSAVVTEAKIDITAKLLFELNWPDHEATWSAVEPYRALARASLAATRPDNVTTRLAEAEDRAAKAEAECVTAAAVLESVTLAWRENFKQMKARATAAEAQVADLTARADKAEATESQLRSVISAQGTEMAHDRKTLHEIAKALKLYDASEVTAAQVAALTAKLDEARGVLREFEWSGTKHFESGAWSCCPECQRISIAAHDGRHWLERVGGEHDQGCRLAAVLAPETGKEDTLDAELDDLRSGISWSQDG